MRAMIAVSCTGFIAIGKDGPHGAAAITTGTGLTARRFAADVVRMSNPDEMTKKIKTLC